MEAKHTYGSEPLRQPVIEAGDIEVYSEHGRDIENVCYCSHWFKIVRAEFGGFYLLVRHGGGEERVRLSHKKIVINSLAKLESDERYLLMWQMLDIKHESERAAISETRQEIEEAFVGGRLKKRYYPKRGITKVWIEPKKLQDVKL